MGHRMPKKHVPVPEITTAKGILRRKVAVLLLLTSACIAIVVSLRRPYLNPHMSVRPVTLPSDSCSVTLYGTILTAGEQVSAWFEWGETPELGQDHDARDIYGFKQRRAPSRGTGKH